MRPKVILKQPGLTLYSEQTVALRTDQTLTSLHPPDFNKNPGTLGKIHLI